MAQLDQKRNWIEEADRLITESIEMRTTLGSGKAVPAQATADLVRQLSAAEGALGDWIANGRLITESCKHVVALEVAVELLVKNAIEAAEKRQPVPV